MESKECTGCKENKPLLEFYLQKAGRYGRHAKCKACLAKYQKDTLNGYVQNMSEEQICKKRAYIVEYYRRRAAVDPIFYFKRGIRSSMSTYFKQAAKGQFLKAEHTVDLLQCSLEFFLQYIQEKFTEGMTLENYGEWHLDHIIPLATAITREDVVRLNHYTNFQPLWAKDNLSKGAKLY